MRHSDIMIDITTLIAENLKGERRNTGMLHCSSHMTAPLRHTQLEMTGLYEKHFDLMGAINMHKGTLWHEWLEKAMYGIPRMSEVDLTPYLPDGWTGRCDYLIWSNFYKMYQVVDIKTTKPEAMAYLNGKPKEDHVWQVSAYVWAAHAAGIPVDTGEAFVYYLPMNPIPGKDIEPAMISFTPLDMEVVQERMSFIQDAVANYLHDIDTDGKRGQQITQYRGSMDAEYLNKYLAPIEPPSQKLYKNATQKCYDVKMVPHWTHNYCPYPEVCGCSEQRTYKIGHFARLADESHSRTSYTTEYVPRRGYETVPLTVTTPTEGMMNSL